MWNVEDNDEAKVSKLVGPLTGHTMTLKNAINDMIDTFRHRGLIVSVSTISVENSICRHGPDAPRQWLCQVRNPDSDGDLTYSTLRCTG